MKNCIYCNSSKLYYLKNEHIKCASCKKKFSLKKYKRELKLIDSFCENKTALETSKNLKLNYITVSKKFMLYRKHITNLLDNEYIKRKDNKYEFDEYIYIKNNNLKAAQNFLTFNYNGYIYNIMLPSLSKFVSSNNKDLSNFIKFNKITKLESSNSMINDFWNFLEIFLKKYKGLNSENFVLYLKECEFKFNYSKKTQEEILLKLLA
ncbi:transposase [Arcobacter roscoffensis]|uniref:Transposase n=1 Tax=Arcobacter roscoffensis TaxID=2961520 RepID=A0ABY5E2D6_9BACT|nr:transposase [Arcobacter roscoffensis]UTJ06037.1 transposase [Arcobacter roscoffensis]